ncbi:MAG: zf-TFIIB domain-containing protein [Verrucomicrobiota bacterium]
MTCPKCQKPMEKVSFEGIDVDRCTGCRGIWFDALEAEELLKLPGSEQIDTGDTQRGEGWNPMQKAECPVCHTRMIRMVDNDQPHIRYEACKLCGGLFLDAGEFRDLKEESLKDWLKSLFRKRKAQ